MKLIIIIIILIIVYLIFTHVKLVHFNTLPSKDKYELEERSKIRSMLINNHIKSDEDIDNLKQAPLKIEHFSVESKPDIIDLIKKYHLNRSYKFNIPNLPVQTSTSTSTSTSFQFQTKKYTKKINSDMSQWQKITKCKIHIQKINILMVVYTDVEAIITANAYLFCENKPLCVELKYYFRTEQPDEFDREEISIIQLIEITPMKRKKINYSPFISMKDQMAYVNSVDTKHKNEDYKI